MLLLETVDREMLSALNRSRWVGSNKKQFLGNLSALDLFCLNLFKAKSLSKDVINKRGAQCNTPKYGGAQSTHVS